VVCDQQMDRFVECKALTLSGQAFPIASVAEKQNVSLVPVCERSDINQQLVDLRRKRLLRFLKQ